MRLLHRFAAIVRWIFRRREAESRLDDEVRSFVEMSVADKIRDGLSPVEARRRALAELGGIEPIKEQVRRYRHGGGLDEIARDIRYAVRMFARTPSFTFIVVLTLALGIGANTAIFSLIDALMLRMLPVSKPQELVLLRLGSPGGAPGGESFSYAIVRALADRHDIFSGVAGFTSTRFDVGSAGALTGVDGAWVTGGYYSTLGLKPAAGRLLTAKDDQPGAALTAVISDGYWQRRFDRNPAAIGSTLHVEGQPVTIVGVSPKGFVGTTVGVEADITLSVAALPRLNPPMAALVQPGNFWLRALARPLPGTSPAQAAARLDAAWPEMAEQVIAPSWPASRRKAMSEMRFEMAAGGTGWTFLRAFYRKPLLILMGIVGLVLLIACANVASLLLARGSARQKEFALRLAIGAGRGRIVRQLLIESTLLSLAGAALGIVLAATSSRLLVDLISTGPVRMTFDLTPNTTVFAFTAGVAIATSLLFGAAPALQTSSTEPSIGLKDGAEDRPARSRLLPALVVAQVALSLVLLAGAGLFLRTLQNLRGFDPGFTAQGVLVAVLDGQQPGVVRRVLDELRVVPGVAAATLATHTPMNGAIWSEPVTPAGRPLPERDNAHFVGTDPGFFTTMQTRMIAGRDFSERDTANAPPVAIVNAAFAARHFGDRVPVGHRLAGSVRGERRELEIVGVVESINTSGLRSNAPPTVYLPYAQLPVSVPASVIVRGTRMGDTAAAFQQILHEAVPGKLIEVKPLSAQVESTIVQERMMAALTTAFGVLALSLACVGLYGLLAYSVAQRTREIGIRMALGAPAQRVIALILRRGVMLVLIGAALGVPATLLASRTIESMLFNLAPADPIAVGGAAVLLVAAACVAAYIPARRASRVDPLVALRYE